jgi:hypothetical protein
MPSTSSFGLSWVVHNPLFDLRCVNDPQVCRRHKMNLVIQARTFRISQYDLKVRLDTFEINAGARYRPSCSRSTHKCVDTTVSLSPNLGSLSPLSIEYPVYCYLVRGLTDLYQ